MERSIRDEYKRILGGKPTVTHERSVGPATREDKPVPELVEPSNLTYRSLAKYKDGELKELIVTSNLMKNIYFKGEPRPEACPRKIYHSYLLGDLPTPPSEIMMRGSLFEAICSNDDVAEAYYKDKLRLHNGKQSVHTQRIYEQARMFDMIASKYRISMDKTQVKYSGELQIDRFEHIKFSLEGTGDVESLIDSPQFAQPMACLDIKLTQDRNSEFGEYCWGAPQFMDHTQLVLYSYLSGLPSAYIVFDYKAKDRGHKIIPIATLEMFPNGQPDNLDLRQHYNVAKDRFTDLKVLIKDTVHSVLKWDAEGYQPNPSFDGCKDCLLNPINQLESDPKHKCSMASHTEII